MRNSSCIPIDTYCLDELMRDLVGHDRKPSAYLLYLYLWRRDEGAETWNHTASLSELAESTGLSKRSIQQGLQWLERRGLLSTVREKATGVADIHLLQPWRARRRR